jgi:hypothetical protein
MVIIHIQILKYDRENQQTNAMVSKLIRLFVETGIATGQRG